MKKIILSFLLILGFANAFGQTDKHGNPVFNSKLISEEKFDEFDLTSSYYTIDNNISNKKSSVYLNDNPTSEEYLNFARKLPSNFFIIHKNQKIKYMIAVLPKIDGDKTTLIYNVINPNTGKNFQVDCLILGEISELRANELISLKADTSAMIIDLPDNGKGFVYNSIVYKIQPYDKLKEDILKLATELESVDEILKNPIAYIKKESKGGDFDFEKRLEKEKDGFFIGDNIAYSKKEFALYLWGKNVRPLGIKSSGDAIELWEEIYGRNLSDSEEKALENGFNSKPK